MKASFLWLGTLHLCLSGCGGGTAPAEGPKDAASDESGASGSVRTEAELPSSGEARETSAGLASPVSGPALDDLPPPPPARVEHAPVDLMSLSEPPRLVIDSLGHTGRISSLIYTPDGRALVSAGHDKAIRVWSATTGELERTIRGQMGDGPAGRIHSLAISPDARFLAVGGWLGTEANPSNSSSSPAFQIRVLDYYSESVYRLLSAHSDVVLSTAFSHSGAKLISGSGDRRAVIWDVMGGHAVQTLYGHTGAVKAVAWSKDDSTVVTGSADNTARLWESASGRAIATLTGHQDEVRSVTFTPSGRSVLTGSLDGTVRLWDAQSGAALKTLANVGAPVGSAAVSPDGLHVLVTTARAPFASHVYNINTGTRVAVHTGQNNVVLASAISPNGKWAATAGGDDFSVAVWDLKSGQSQIRSEGHGQTIWNVGFARDGSSIAWGSDYDSAHTGQYQLNGPLRFKLPIRGASGSLLSVASAGTNQTDFVRAVVQQSGVELRTGDGKEHETLEVSAQGTQRAVIRRDLTSGFVHRAFSLTPDAKTVVSGGDNGVLASFDAMSGRKLADFEGHTGDILALAVSPDGTQVVTGSTDQTVRLWDLKTGAPLLTVFHAKNGEWVAFTPAGYYASSAYGDGYVGWHANRGDNQPAAYFPAQSLSAQLRSEQVVRQFLLLGGNISGAIDACNKLLSSGVPPLTYYRFEDLPQFAPPDVYYLDPGHDLRIESDRLEVTARAHSPSAEPIVSLTFLVNGRPVDDRWMNHVGRPRVRLSGRDAEVTAILPLPEKKNRISVIATNRYNESVPVTFEVERTGGPKELEKIYQPELHLLSIGISTYGSPHLKPLSYAHKDAEAISELIEKKNKTLFKSVDARLLTERNATRQALLSGLDWLAYRSSAKDVAIIFLSGYADRDSDGKYYFIPHDADSKRLSETAVAFDDLKSKIELLSAKVILLVDTSHAGALTDSNAVSPVNVSDLLRAEVSRERGVVVMTSSSGSGASFESSQWKHGAFTKALLDGLGGQADYDRDHFIFIRELEHYVSKRVPQLTGGKQRPTTDVPSTLPNFPFSQR